MGYSIAHMLQVWNMYQHLPEKSPKCRWIYQHHGSHLGIEKCWGYSLLSRPQIFSGYPTGSHDGFFTSSLEAKTLRVCWPILTAFNWLGFHPPLGIPYAPWCWNIHLHLPNKWPSFVGKYTSTMEHMGMFIRRFPKSTMTSGNHRKKHVPQNQSKLECKSTNIEISLEQKPVHMRSLANKLVSAVGPNRQYLKSPSIGAYLTWDQPQFLEGALMLIQISVWTGESP